MMTLHITTEPLTGELLPQPEVPLLTTAQELMNRTMATASGEFDWEAIARAGFTDQKLARQVAMLIQMGAHMVDGSVSDRVALDFMRLGTVRIGELLRERMSA